MEEDKVIQIRFSEIKIASSSSCKEDYIQIFDGDGTELLSKTCASVYLPPVTISYTNKAVVIFHTDNNAVSIGWRLKWREGKWNETYYLLFTHM